MRVREVENEVREGGEVNEGGKKGGMKWISEGKDG